MNIDQLIDDVIGREGGYSDHPADKGGPTKWGITEAVAAFSPSLGRSVDLGPHVRTVPAPDRAQLGGADVAIADARAGDIHSLTLPAADRPRTLVLAWRRAVVQPDIMSSVKARRVARRKLSGVTTLAQMG